MSLALKYGKLTRILVKLEYTPPGGQKTKTNVGITRDLPLQQHHKKQCSGYDQLKA